MLLPKTVNKDVQVNPKRMLIYSFPKAGKTTAFTGLENNLLIDTEDGSNYSQGLIINVLEEAGKILNCPTGQVKKHPEGMTTILQVLRDIVTSISEENVKNNGYVYDHITIDSVSGLIPIATFLASEIYKKTVIGKNYTGNDVVMDLPNGGGYEYLRIAFDKILSSFDGLATDGHLHLIAHVKDASILKDGKDLSARDIMLPGKLKNILAQNADAIGFIYRKEGTKTILSFKTDERDLATGARPAHLAGKEFVLVEETEKGSRNFKYGWDQIFLK